MCLLVFDLIIELNTLSLVLIKNLSLHKQKNDRNHNFYRSFILPLRHCNKRHSKFFAKKIENLREQLYNFSFIPSKQYAVDRGLDGFSEVFLQYDLNVASEKYLLLLVYYLRA